MLCSEQIAQLGESEIENQLGDLNAELFVIGSGTIEEAAKARERLKSAFTFLVDPKRDSFKAAGMRKDFRSTINLRTVPAIFRAWRKGHRQKKLQGDPFQQGGVLAITPDNIVAYRFISQYGGDHPNPQDIVEQLKQYLD
jgi:hypothetical protein